MLWLFNDTGTALLGPITLGLAGTVQNSQCTVNGATSSLLASGSTLTLNLAMTFPASFAGAKGVYAYAQSAAGINSGWTALGTWTVPGSSPPQVLSVSPASGSGVSQTFTFAFSNPFGASELNTIQVLFNGALSGYQACYPTIDPVHGLLWLFNDSGTALLGPITLGLAGTVQNSQCTLNGATSSLLASGNTLTLNLAMAFTTSFGGAKGVYAYAQTASLSSGWTSLGTWTVPGSSPPQVLSVSPSSGSGVSQTFTFAFSNPSGASNVNTIQVLFNGTLSGYQACYPTIDPVHGLLWLFNDNGTALLGPIALGLAGTVRNSQCAVNGATSSLLASGNTLTLNLGVTFPTSFAGAKGVYAYAQSAAGVSSGWTEPGAWVVP
jgi:hypothetical protein